MNLDVSSTVRQLTSEKKSNMTKNRPKWPITWMSIAEQIAKHSCDERFKVGAIVVTNDNTCLLSLGYNGQWKKGPNKPDSNEPGKSGLIHAEENALIKLDYNNPKDKIMYVTLSPCRMCAKRIINADIKRVVYKELYRDPSGVELLKSAGIEVFSIEEANELAYT